MTFPKIDAPCPFRLDSLPEPGRDFCTQCQRRVHNLDALSEAERHSLLAQGTGTLCVAYTAVRRRPTVTALVGLGIAAAVGLSATSHAEDAGPRPAQSPAPEPEAHVIELCILAGGVVRPEEQRSADDAQGAPPELPIRESDAFLNAPPLRFVAPPAPAAKPKK